MCQEIEREGDFYLSQCKYFKSIEKMKACAFVKDPINSKVKGLCYKIQQHDLNRYAVIVKSWEYNIYNEYYERPVLSYSILFDLKQPNQFKIKSAKIMSCPVKINAASTSRFMEASALIIRQVQSGTVIDASHILGIYRIRPTSMMCESVTVKNNNEFEGFQKYAS